MFDIFYIGRKPGLFPHEKSAKSIQDACDQCRTRYFWIVNYLSDYTGWDFLWEPVPWQQEFIHVWPSQHHEFSGTYLVPKNCKLSNYHFHDKIIPNLARPQDFLCQINGVDFDWTWAPHPMDPPFNYVFGNQWWPANKMPTVEFRVPGATQDKFMPIPATLPARQDHWEEIHKCNWDYSWVPDPDDPPYIYVFGNQWYPPQVMPTMKYHVPGATQEKYMHFPRAELLPDSAPWQVPKGIDTWDYSWQPDPGSPPYNYQFGTQHQKTGGPVYVMPGATETKFQTYPRAVKTSQDNHWEVPSGVDVESFDWTWHPDATEPPYIYQFGTQHQRTGGPRYVVPGALEIKFVEQIKITTKRTAGRIYVIDHMDGNAAKAAESLSLFANVVCVRYFDNYLDTLKRIAKNANNDYVEFAWIISSVCDYSNFDFSWHPEQWQAHMLHVFASNNQKFGDTFFMHVPTFVDRSQTCKLLEWYNCNFVPDISVPRFPMPVVYHQYDSHVDAVKSIDFEGPLALFTVEPQASHTSVTVPLWREQVKTMVPLAKGAASVIVPKVSIPYIRTQLYDYPNIDKTQASATSSLMDVVFISNGEPMAEQNLKTLRQQCPRAKHSQGVTGREQAYKAAAQLSDTPWFFAVFAKTEVLPDFTFDFQPDRLQAPKHYIFHSRNPLNGLEYGAMNINLYNRQLVLDTIPGIDFTLSAAHEVVPICASVSRFNTDPWITWRSAFREVLKLKQEVNQGAGVEIQYRLNIWCTKATGENAKHCLQGANDALEYYQQVNGNNDKLRLSFDWAWLQDYYYNKYQARPWLEVI